MEKVTQTFLELGVMGACIVSLSATVIALWKWGNRANDVVRNNTEAITQSTNRHQQTNTALEHLSTQLLHTVEEHSRQFNANQKFQEELLKAFRESIENAR